MGKKDYKKGMADALEANAGFAKKQAAATEHVADEVKKVGKKIDKVGEKIGEMKDYITDREKAALYKLNTPVDIADLDSNEKRVLLAVLYQLSADEEELTEAQQGYVRAVQQYLKLYNPQTEIDLDAVENLEDISAQKAILQAVLEFFYLGTHPGSFTEDQMEVLDYFQVNRKTRREISDHIKAIVDTVGLQGLAEKYGFVAGQPETGFLSYNDNGDVSEQVAEAFVSLYNGKNRPQPFDYGLMTEYLDTTHYIVFCRTNEDSKDVKGKYQLFRMDKHTGEIAPLPIDYKKDLCDLYPWNLQYHIHGDMLYLIPSDFLGGDSMKSIHPIAVDVDKLTCRVLPLEFKCIIESSNKFPHFHLSGDSTRLVVYAFEIDYFASSRRKTSLLSKIHVIDLTQDRAFLIEPGMPVRDAFWWDNSLMLLGKQGKDISIFRYDMATKTATNIFEGEYSSVFADLGIFSLGQWFDAFDKGLMVKHMEHFDERFYFLLKEFLPGPIGFHLRTPDIADTRGAALCEIPFSFSGRRQTFYFHSGQVFLYNKDDDDFCQYDFATQKGTQIDKGGAQYLLLGDWLFKRKDKTWYKANISKGTDALQWEVMPETVPPQ